MLGIIAAAFICSFVAAVLLVEGEHRVAEWWHRRKKRRGE